jgi:hypothetical protein
MTSIERRVPTSIRCIEARVPGQFLPCLLRDVSRLESLSSGTTTGTRVSSRVSSGVSSGEGLLPYLCSRFSAARQRLLLWASSASRSWKFSISPAFHPLPRQGFNLEVAPLCLPESQREGACLPETNSEVLFQKLTRKVIAISTGTLECQDNKYCCNH